jgi:hypothetical protein
VIVTPLVRMGRNVRLRAALIGEASWYLAADILHQHGINFSVRRHQAALEALPEAKRLIKTREELGLAPGELRDHRERIVLVRLTDEPAVLEAVVD